MSRWPSFASLAVIAVLFSGPAYAAGYLDQPLNFSSYLAAPPAIGSAADKTDLLVFNRMALPVDSARWQMAGQDAQAYGSEQIVERFRAALALPDGAAMTRDNAPHLLALLDRMDDDAQATVIPAKNFFMRIRPYLRLNIARYCGANLARAGTGQPKQGYSYPSGHATRGWIVALVLARIAPDHAGAILARGRDYAESRVVCRVHYPSDIAAGQVIATALFEREAQADDFQADLAAARAEYAALVK